LNADEFNLEITGDFVGRRGLPCVLKDFLVTVKALGRADEGQVGWTDHCLVKYELIFIN
jgi:hypothetical protein